MIDLLLDYRSVIALEDDQLGCTQVITHKINVPQGTPPMYIPAYRVPHSQRKIVNDAVDKMLKDKVIEPSDSPWNFPLVLVPKKNGQWRIVIDFRKLNDITIPDRYPCTHMGDLLSSLGHNTYFSSLDLLSGFLQVPLHEDSQKLTAFSTEKGHYHFKRMPFGLRSSPITFTRLINTVFHGMLGTVVHAYMDDLIIASQSLTEHFDKLRKVFDRLKQANLKIKLSKCDFLKRQISYLGHKISDRGIEVTNDKVSAIINFPVPKTTKHIKSFLGLAGFYRAFVRNFSTIAAPLTSLLKKDIPFSWKNEQQQAFDALKNALTSPPVLAFPNYDEEFFLVTDASDIGIGGCLMQKDERNKFQPIGYYSRKLRNSAETNLSVCDREALAIVECLKHFKYIIFGYSVTVLTDNSAATELFKNPMLSGKRARWFVTAQSFDLNVRYIPGKSNVVADCLSRIPEIGHVVFAVKELLWTNELLIKEQDKDPILGPIKRHLALPETERPSKSFEIDLTKLRLQDNLLLRDVTFSTKTMPNRTVSQLVIPQSLVPEALNIIHDRRERAHPGKERSLAQGSLNYFWPNMKQDIENHIDKCATCAETKTHRPSHAPILNYPAPTRPFQRVSMDLLTNLNETRRNYRHIMVVIDHLTRYCELVPLTSKRAEECALAFYDNILCRYAAPDILISDNGREFVNAFMKELCNVYGVRHLHIIPYHPASNGVSERTVRKVLESLRTTIGSNDPNWDLHLPSVQMAINSAYHSTIQEIPHYALFGYSPRFPYELMATSPAPVYNEDPIRIRINNAKKLFDTLRANLERSKVIMAEQKNKQAKPHNFVVNEHVYLRKPVLGGLNYKLDSKYMGPYVIVKIAGNRISLELIADRNIKRDAHPDQLKRTKVTFEPHPMRLRSHSRE